MTVIQRLGGRKFIATVGCGLATTILTYLGSIDGSIYATVTIATVGGFITGNVWQKKMPDDEENRGKP